MRVLSIKQPWATLIVRGIKKFEARTWQTPHRGRIALHASSGIAPGIFEEADENEALGDIFCSMGWAGLDDLKSLPRVAVVGTVEIESIHQAAEIWAELTPTDRALVGPFDAPPDDIYLWRLRNPRTIQPVPINGKLNLWTLPDAESALVEEARGLLPHELPDTPAVAVAAAKAARGTRIEEQRLERERTRAQRVQICSPLADLVGFEEGTLGSVVDAIFAYAQLHLHPKGGIVVTPAIQALFRRKRVVVDLDEVLAEASKLTTFLDE